MLVRLCVALLVSLSVCRAQTSPASSSPAAPSQPTPFQPAPSPSRPQALDRAHAAATRLLVDFDPHTGLFKTTGWWNSANAVTALVDTARLRTDPAALRALLRTTFTTAPHGNSKPAPNFLNDFYDDEGWWALAWIDAYDLTRQPQYLGMARTIFHDMSLGWDTTCNGGIWWSKERNYKNAIANELFLSVAAALADRTSGSDRTDYLDWAHREWRWFQASGMINPDHLVNDGLQIDAATHVCTNNGKTTWTYNQGVLLGGLASLHHASADPSLLSSASAIASAAITHLVDSDGILHDPCEPQCGGDGVSFKGIFVRNLAQLQATAPDPAFVRFLQHNATVLWSADRLSGSPEDQARFSTVWSGPPVPDNAAAQASALDLLNAAAAVTP